LFRLLEVLTNNDAAKPIFRVICNLNSLSRRLHAKERENRAEHLFLEQDIVLGVDL
jgi:hypothetical protein